MKYPVDTYNCILLIKYFDDLEMELLFLAVLLK